MFFSLTLGKAENQFRVGKLTLTKKNEEKHV
jgi:hypothetical protein